MNTTVQNKWELDTIDKLIFEEGLRIKTLFFDVDLDLMLVILNNKRVIETKISNFNSLKQANLSQLNNYEISRTGVHWPSLDEDLSLRGFLKEEMEKVLRKS
jgi:hypothetical protein